MCGCTGVPLFHVQRAHLDFAASRFPTTPTLPPPARTGGSADTHLAAFEVYSRKGRLLLALGAVQRSAALAGAADPRVHSLVVRLCQQVQQQPSSVPVVQQVLSEGVAQLLGGSSLSQYAQSYAEGAAVSGLAARAAAAEMLLVAGAGDKAAAVKLLMASDPAAAAGAAAAAGSAAQRPGALHAQCVAVHQLLLQGPLADAEAAAAWKARCAEVLPWSAYFEGSCRVAVPQAPAAAANGAAAALGKLSVK